MYQEGEHRFWNIPKKHFFWGRFPYRQNEMWRHNSNIKNAWINGMKLKNHHRKAKTGINEMKWQKPSQKGKSPPSSFPLHSLTSTTDLIINWWNQ